ncbi:rod shape-determining protein MreC [Paraferrimonas sedimenticola]|uniref:Cell shape-determining protein MreC n=1 Tax=Paraferrimonas sedimenticola TaxID=375674 RepID=A0AA37RXP5_9GAMM|nr:rod shape-determining protein MreC [Paraferrimonas sedimenticola]GLP97371.1 rod shape-determining protein MreC [Paraferrimonas sedimenticola]
MNPIFGRGVSIQFRLTIAIVLSLVLLFAKESIEPARQSLSSLLSPLQLIANVPGDMLDWANESFASRNELKRQNREMLKQQLLMSERLQRFEQLNQENNRLRALLGSPMHQDAQKMVAEVMAVESDPYHHYVTLGAGSKDGVFVGQPVIDDKAIIGQITQVSYMSSQVLLISDATHAIPVRVARNDVRAVVQGVGNLDELEIRHLPTSTDIKAGDLLVSSGLGGRFPEGYPVARVDSVERGDGRRYAKIRVRPLASLDRIRYLLLLWPEGERPGLDAEEAS